MRKPTFRKLTLLQDKQEKVPLLFPANLTFRLAANCSLSFEVVMRKANLRPWGGDYMLLDGPTVVERKGSVNEVATNLLTADRARQLASFDTLAANCKYPVLLMENSPTEFRPKMRVQRGPRRVILDAREAWDALLLAMRTRGIQLLVLGPARTPVQRRNLGDRVLRLLVADLLFENGYAQK